nr:hypothetical protein Iba_chr06aCG8080 [Ipomoea batatas]GMD05555.1 hypothetical protein Iba_chr06bCG7570 [Ipomoea batatas]
MDYGVPIKILPNHCCAHCTLCAPPGISSSSSYASCACCCYFLRISSSMFTSCKVVSSHSSNSISVICFEGLGGSTPSRALHWSGDNDSGKSTVKWI